VLKVGEIAPDFAATSTSGKTVKLSELRGKRVVMFFFPKAMTTGCTIETRLFRDHYTEMTALGAEVIGVSVDSNDKQCEFASREGVPFPMIGDSKKSIGKSYDVMWPLLGVTQRVTYVVDPQGRVEAVFHHELMVGRHLEDVKRHLQSKAL